MKLKVPHLYQKEKDLACGLIGLRMILSYYGRDLSYNELTELWHRDERVGSWWAELGCIALKLGFKVELINYNLSHIYNASFAKITDSKKQIPALRALKDQIDRKYWPELDYNIKMIKQGGKLSIRVPSISDIKQWLRQGIPPLISVKVGPAYGKPVSKTILDQHGLVVYGIDKNRVYIRDPHPVERENLTSLSIDNFIYSWYCGKAYTLLVKK